MEKARAPSATSHGAASPQSGPCFTNSTRKAASPAKIRPVLQPDDKSRKILLLDVAIRNCAIARSKWTLRAPTRAIGIPNDEKPSSRKTDIIIVSNQNEDKPRPRQFSHQRQ